MPLAWHRRVRFTSAVSVLGVTVSLIGACSSPGPSTRGASRAGDSAAAESTGTPRGDASAESTVAPLDSLSVQGAVDVVRQYYDAINDRDFERAYRLWGSDGAASGRTYERFAAGFDNTARVEPTLGEPGPMGAAAGSRYVEVPVTLHAVTRQGVDQRFRGHYVLRRSVVDGATPVQHRWHIDSAKMTAAR